MASIKAKKMTAPQFRKALAGIKEEELMVLLEGIYRHCPDASNYLNVRLAGEAFEKALLEETKEKVRGDFFSKRGKPYLKTEDAKRAISDFEKADPSPESIIDLQIYFVENAVEIINKYTRIPDNLFRDANQMFVSVAKSFGQIEDPDTGHRLADLFRERMDKLVLGVGAEDQWFFKELREKLTEIRWIAPDPVDNKSDPAGDKAAPGEEASDPGPELPPLIDTSNVLSDEDADLFYKLWLPLLDYVNARNSINNMPPGKPKEERDTEKVKQVVDALWADVSVIDEYLASESTVLPPEHQSIIAGWKRCCTGRFVLERNLKKGSILISLEDNRVFQVRGITATWEELFLFRDPPILMMTTLIPYRGIIIYDGLINSYNVFLGGHIKNQMREIYMSAKKRGQIHTSL